MSVFPLQALTDHCVWLLQLAVVRQVLRKELGLKIVEVDTEKAIIEGGDVLWTGSNQFQMSVSII